MEFLEDSSPSSSSELHTFILEPGCSSPQPDKPKRRAGRKKFHETRHPVYKGVRQRNGKWVCELRQPYNKSRIWLGTFSTPEAAAMAYDVAALALKGGSASLNFPEVARILPRPTSSSIRDIQSAALEAAKAFGNPKSFSTSLLSHVQRPVKVTEPPSRKLFLDEEALFNMPALLDSMAEGLLLAPPAMQTVYIRDDVDDEVDLTLWTD